MLEAVRAACPDIELTVDANSAYTLADTELLRELRRVRPALHRAAAALGRPARPRRARPLARHADLPRRVADVAGAGAGRARPGRVHRRQRQGRSVRRPDAVQRVHDMCVERDVADVVRRHARDRHRARPQHPPRDDARASSTRATPRRRAARTPRHHRAAARGGRRHHAGAGRAPASASRSIAPFLDAGDRERRGRPRDGRTLEFRELRDADELGGAPGVRAADLGRRVRDGVGQRARRDHQRGRDGDRCVRRSTAGSRRCRLRVRARRSRTSCTRTTWRSIRRTGDAVSRSS